MCLESDRLVLKELSWYYLKSIHFLYSNPEVDQFNTIGIPKSIDDTREIIRDVIEDKGKDKRTKYSWVILIKSGSIFLGEIGLNLAPERFRMAEIYYNLVPDRWGRGFATEAARRILDFAFYELNLHRIIAGVATGNTGSIRVLEKLGMKREGMHRDILPIRGEWKDNFSYAILENEYKGRNDHF